MRYIKSYLKFLRRNKFYTIVNVTGLSLSFCFLILLSCYLYTEFTVDSNQEKADRIKLLANESDTYNAFLLGEFIEERIPGIEESCAYCQVDKSLITINGKEINTDNSIVVSSNFLDFFSFRLIEGNRSNALANANSVLISESFAKKEFGDSNPIGQLIYVSYKDANDIEAERVFVINGVLENFVNSIFPDCDLIYQQDALRIFSPNSLSTSLNYLSAQIFILTNQNSDIKESDLLSIFKKEYWCYTSEVPWGAYTEVNIIPLRDVYFQKDINVFPLRTNNRLILIILIITSGIILGFSILNYMILTIAQTGFRAKEMVVNKLYGATKLNILLRITFESASLFLLSVVVGFVLALGVESSINKLIGENIDLWAHITIINVIGGLMLVFIAGMMIGVIPGLIVSRYKPIDIFKGKFIFNMKMYYSKGFIFAQTFINILLIITSLAINKQMYYLLNFDYGYNHKNIIELNLDNIEPRKVAVIKETVRNLAGVRAVGMTMGTPYDSGLGIHTKIEGMDNTVYIEMLTSDYATAKMFDYIIIQDNNLAEDGVWVNETFIQMLGGDYQLKEISIPDYGYKFKIAGIVKDFYMSSVLDDNSLGYVPVILQINETISEPWSLLVETETQSEEIINNIQSIYEEEKLPMEEKICYVETILDNKFAEHRKIRNLIELFSLISFVISIMGLFAISSYYIKQKSKEISLRSVMGATSSELFIMLVFYFLKLVLIAFAISCPVAIWGLNKWLNSFNYRITITPWIFIASFCIVFIISFLTVSGQSYKAVKTNLLKGIKD